MKRVRVIISIAMVLIMLFTNLQIPYLRRDNDIYNFAEEYIMTDVEAVNADKVWLTFDRILNGNNDRFIIGDLNLPVLCPNGSNISWKSDNEMWVSSEGIVTRPPFSYEGDQRIILTAIISKGDEVSEKTFDMFVENSPESLEKGMDNIPLALKFNKFSNVENMLQFNGISSISTIDDLYSDENSKALRFTNGASSTGGSAFTKNRIHLNDDMSFSTYFSFEINPEDKPSGHGGFTFTLQSDDNMAYGQSLDSVGSEGIKPSVSIKFETYYFLEQGSPAWSKGYLGVLFNGIPQPTLGMKTMPYSISDGYNNHVWIEYDGLSQTLEVRVTRLCERPEEPTWIIENIDMTSIFTDEEGISVDDVQNVYAGFTGSTGDVDETNDILNWYFKNDSTPIDLLQNTYMDASNMSLMINTEASDELNILTATINGAYVPAIDVPIYFTTSLGTLYSPSTKTDLFGNAIAALSSDISGTATVKVYSQGGAFVSKEVQFEKFEKTDEEAVAADKTWLSQEWLLNGNSSIDKVTGDLSLPLKCPFGSTISWTSSNVDIVKFNGDVSRPVYPQKDEKVTLTATINKGDAQSEEKSFDVIVKATEAVIEDYKWLTPKIILKDNIELDNIRGNMYLPNEGQNGSTIVWSSTDEEVVAQDGTVSIPTDYNKEIMLIATILKENEQSLKKTFIIEVVVTDERAVIVDNEWLDYMIYEGMLLKDNSAFENITGDLYLPSLGPCGSYITWESSDDDVVAIDKTDGKVTRPNYNEEDKNVTLTAIITKGIAEPIEKTISLKVIAAEKTYQDILNEDMAWLTDEIILNDNSSLDNVTSNLYLPSYADPNYSYISWVPSNWDRIDSDGTVIRPTYSQGDMSVTLTAILSASVLDEAEKIFTITVKAIDPANDAEAVDADKIWLTEYQLLNGNISLNNVTGNLNLPDKGPNGSDISWFSTDKTVIKLTGNVIRPEFNQGDKEVTLIATIFKGDVQPVEKTFAVIVKILEPTDEEAVFADEEWLTNELVLNENNSLDSVIGKLNLPTQGFYNSTINWNSTDENIVAIDGTVTRPAFKDGSKVVTLKAILFKGDIQPVEKEFTITVKALNQTDEEAVETDVEWLTDKLVLNGNSALDNIKGNMYFPTCGSEGSSISWSSTNESVVSLDGTVNRQLLKEDVEVILTANISKGDVTPVEKTFTVVVRKTDETDVSLDIEWIGEVILKDNSSFDSVTGELYLPDQGPNGSNISWTSSNEDVVTLNETVGIVNIPTYNEGNKIVELTATLSKGDIQNSNIFTVIVKAADQTDEEAMTADKAWLSENLVRKDNDINDYYVVSNLYMPTIGPNGCTISWKSSNESVVALDGTVTRPIYTQGMKTVTITATISKGDEQSLEKKFTFAILVADLTDEVAVDADKDKLSISYTLNGNASQYSITDDISLPNSFTYGSIITWESSMPTVIDNSGKVTRPEYFEGHKSVTMTATFIKGEVEDTKVFEYTVLAIPDTESPYVISTNPLNNDTNVLFDNRQITITFNEDIEKGENWDKIRATYKSIYNGDIPVSILVESISRIDNNKLIITLAKDMKFGEEYEIFIPRDAINDLSGNNLLNSFELQYSVEQKQMREIKIIFSSPQNRQVNVSAKTRQISLEFSYTDIFEGSEFDKITLSDVLGDNIPITRELNGDTITLNLETEAELELGQTYEINIPAGAVKDRYNINRVENIQFRTIAELIPPEVSSIYPASGSDGIDIHQSIEISFTEMIKADYSLIKLLDEKGNKVPSSIRLFDGDKKLMIRSIQPLKPETQYTVLIPAQSICDFSDNYLKSDYEMSLTTGLNKLNVDNVNLSDGEIDVSLNTSVELQFPTEITKGMEFENIKITNSEGSPVPFKSLESDNNVILTPDTVLEPAELYSLYIPSGAFKSSDNNTNDTLNIMFITASHLKTDSSFIVKPSSNYFTNIPVTFSAEWLNDTFNNMGREIISYEWNLGDENIKNGKIIDYTYNETGEYVVTLNIIDDKGLSYQYERNINITGYPSYIDISAFPDSYKILRTSNDVSEDITSYDVKVSYKGTGLGERNIKVYLYKENIPYMNLGKITTNKYGMATFNWNYHYLKNGIYDLVFVYGNTEEGKIKRCPVEIYELDEVQSLRLDFKVYREYEYNFDVYSDSYANRVIDYIEDSYIVSDSPYLKVIVDGEEKIAVRDSSGWGNYYISGITGGRHEIQVLDPNYVSDKQVVYLTENYTAEIFVDYIPPLPDAKPIVNCISSFMSNTNSNNTHSKIFIDGVDYMIDLSFSGNWNGHEPGYYELKTPKEIIRSEYRFAHLNLGRDVGPEGRIYGRMVSKDGTTSTWVDAMIEVAPHPLSVDGLDIREEFKEYKIDTHMDICELVADKIPTLKGIPFLNNSKSFGINKDKFKFAGSLNEYGRMELLLGGGYVHNQNTLKKNGGMEKLKKEEILQTAGYQIGGSLFGGIAYQYDENSNKWRFAEGNITLIATGGYSWKKEYLIPVIKIGGYGELTMLADVGGTFIVTRDVKGDKDYKGILYFAPNVEIAIGAECDFAGVEGYGGGKINAQVHIPTGYVQVDPVLYAGIDVKFLLYTRTVLEKEAKTSWNNGKEKIPVITADGKSDSLVTSTVIDDTGLTPMCRDYLVRPSKWYGKNGTQLYAMLGNLEMGTVVDKNPNVQIRKNNIYPDSEVKLVNNNDELWMVWIDDNPERSSMNRTQLMYSVFNGIAWSEPAWIGQDGTCDFSPVAASTGDGVLMAWQNINQTMLEDAELDEFIKNSEISATKNVFKSDSSDVEIVTLTDDDKFDHSPKLAADGDNALLVWTKSEGLGFTFGPDMEEYHSPENSDRLFFSKWNEGAWESPVEIEESLPTVMNSSLALNGDEGLLLYTLDIDNNEATLQDQEIFAKTYDGDKWSEEIRITNNEVPDSNPKAVCLDGEWFITWNEDGAIMYKNGINGETKTSEFLSKVGKDYDISIKDGIYPQIALVYKHNDVNGVQTLSTSFYDADNKVWSDEIKLTEEGYVRSLSSIFTDDGKLNIEYTQAEVITEVIDGIEYRKPSNKVDLCMLSYTPEHDLALNTEDGLQFSYDNPVPGSTVSVTATIRNKGDFAEKATLYLYDGNPKQDGIKIGEAITEQPIPAQSSSKVEVQWIVDSNEKEKYDIYAVVDPCDTIIEIDENNNSINYEIVSADIAVSELDCKNISQDDYMVTAIVKNTGNRALEEIEVYLNQKEEDQPLETRVLEKLEPGQEVQLIFFFSSEDLIADENGEINMLVRASLQEEIDEFSSDNNVYDFKLIPSNIVVDSTEPSTDGKLVDIEQPLMFNFNMNVEQNEEFDKIILEDEQLNTIEINKTLNGSTLIVIPKHPMDYNTRYTLSIPRKAIGDSYNHTMDDLFKFSFVTEPSYPAIVLTYPGDNLEDVDLNTDIKVKFNQNILEGVTFNDIVLYDTESNIISTVASLQEDCIDIKLKESLKKNTEYTLMIPTGAVQNNKNEVLQEDYLMKFTTLIDNDNIDSKSNKKERDYKIIHKISENGISSAYIDINRQSILKLKEKGKSNVKVDLTEKVNKDEVISFNLTEVAVKQLIRDSLGLEIVTGKGDILLPASLIKSLDENGENPITVILNKKESLKIDNDSVSEIFDFSIIVGKQTVSKFDERVVVTIPIDVSKVTNAKRVIVCMYDEDSGDWQPVGGITDIEGGTITFNTKHFSIYAAFEIDKHFDDVICSWSKEKVEILASRRLVNGKSNSTFDPEGNITRAEFIAMVVRSLYTELSKNKETFIDVPKGVWFAETVETAYDLGLVSGNGYSKFEPKVSITREQLATIAYRLYRYKMENEKTNKPDITFKDSEKISNYAKEAVDFVSNVQIMVGVGNNKFEPKRNATRQEASVVLYRLLEYMGEL